MYYSTYNSWYLKNVPIILICNFVTYYSQIILRIICQSLIKSYNVCILLLIIFAQVIDHLLSWLACFIACFVTCTS